MSDDDKHSMATKHDRGRRDTFPPQADNATLLALEDVAAQLKTNNELTQRMCQALLDPGGQLDRLATNQQQNLEIHRDEVNRQLGELRDALNKALMRIGLIESEGSQPKIVANVPFTCLVVDDDADVRNTIRRVLEQAAILVLESPDGEDALHQLRGEAPVDVVLTDLNMPGNGSGLVSHVVQDHPRVELVIMTGYGEGRAASEALEKGAHSYLTKPFPSNDALVLAVIRAAEHRRARSALSPRT